MVTAVRRGQSLRAVARAFAVGVATVAHWVERAKGQRLDRVDWSDRPRAPHQTLGSRRWPSEEVGGPNQQPEGRISSPNLTPIRFTSRRP